MNWDQVNGSWKQFTGKVKEMWGELIDNDPTVSAGKQDQLAGMLQKHYGDEKEKAEKEADEFMHTLRS